MLDPGEETITEAEWAYAIDFLTRTGRKCDAERQEFVLLSDIPGLDTAAMRELFRTSLDGLSRCAASRLPHTRPSAQDRDPGQRHRWSRYRRSTRPRDTDNCGTVLAMFRDRR
jgi:hypothetical protein